MIITSARRLVTAATLTAALWPVAAHAAPVTVDWDVVPHEDRELAFDISPFYECSGVSYGARLCHSLWDGGLTLEATLFSFYDDKWVDGFGLGENESFLEPVTQGLGEQRIRPECKAGLSPCFDLFTPLQMRIDGAFDFGTPPNLFITSSRGGLLKLPSQAGLATIDFIGEEWRNLSWLEVGFYIPAACEDDNPPEELVCRRDTEKALVVWDLTFEPVPEPAVMWLLAAGAAGVVWRSRPRRKS